MDSIELSKDELRLLFESLPELYLVLSPKLIIVEMTAAYARATLIHRSDAIGRHIFDVFPNDPNDANDGVRNLRASLDRVLARRAVDAMPIQKYDVRNPETGKFEERFWSPINSPILSGTNEIRYILHRVEDVTEFLRMRARDAEVQRIAGLGDDSVEPTSAVFTRTQQAADAAREIKESNAELERLYERTKELDELKTQFFANVSHELRTPLALILGPVEQLLASTRLDARERRSLKLVERNARLLMKHVNDLLDASKLEAGATKIEYADVDLASHVRWLASNFESLTEEKRIDYRIEASGPLRAQVDPDKTERILLNLLSNAIKFTPDGGTIRCTLRQVASRAVIEVADSGPGIAETQREAVFERFTQLQGGTTREFGGTGLGLAIARDFARLHAGTLVVADSPEGGALFTLELPLNAPPGTEVRRYTAGPHHARLSTPSQPPSSYVRPITEELSLLADELASDLDRPLILVVEDNRDMSEFITGILRVKYRVEVAYTGASGLARAIDLKPDLILSDMMMPEMSGHDLVRALRTHRDLDGTPIILLTAKGDDQLRVSVLCDGANDFLTKPFSNEELVVRVDTLVRSKKAHERVARLNAELTATLRELSRQQNAGRATTQFLDTVLESIPNMVFIKEAERLAFVRFNRAGEVLLGVPRQELIGKNDYDFFPKEEADAFQAKDRETLRNNRLVDIPEEPIETKSGKRWLHTKKVPIAGLDGTAEYLLGISEDITERRVADEALRRARDAAEEANRELESFSYSVAHDLRAPLRSIDGFSQALIEDYGHRLDEDGKRYLTFVRESAQHMAELIDDLLTLSRVTRSDLHRTTIDVSEIARSALTRLQRSDSTRNVDIQIASGLTADADPRLLTVVFDNLLGNAWKFTSKTANARIELSASEENGERVYAIRDNGAGFDMQYANKLFGVFQRLHSATDFEGTGIGLATVQRVIRRHGGRVWAEGKPENGASFFFTLGRRRGNG